MITVLPTDRSGLKRICPTHKKSLKLQNSCPEGHVVEWNTWLLGKDTPKGFVVVEPTEKPSFEADLALTLVPVPRDQLDSATIEAHGIYYCKPSHEAFEQAWATFRHILSDGKIALVTKAALKKGPRHLYKLAIFNDYLVLRQIEFPDKVTDAPPKVEAKLDKETRKVLDQFVSQITTDFDKFDSTDDNARTLEEWLDTGTVIENPFPEKVLKEAGTIEDVRSMLETLKAAVERSK